MLEIFRSLYSLKRQQGEEVSVDVSDVNLSQYSMLMLFTLKLFEFQEKLPEITIRVSRHHQLEKREKKVSPKQLIFFYFFYVKQNMFLYLVNYCTSNLIKTRKRQKGNSRSHKSPPNKNKINNCNLQDLRRVHDLLLRALALFILLTSSQN